MVSFAQYLSPYAATTTALALLVVYALRLHFVRASHRPSGPSSLAVILSLLGRKEYPWLTFTRWAKQYGHVYSFYLLWIQRIIIVNDFDAFLSIFGAHDVAGRPRFTVAGELMDFNRSTPMLTQGPVLRMHRRLARLVLNTESIREFSRVQDDAIRRCVVGIRARPDAFEEIRFALISSVVELVYGMKLQSPDDPFIKQADVVLNELARAILPGSYLADIIPILKHIPTWFIGAGFKRHALRVRKDVDAMFGYPFKFAKELMVSGSSQHSFVADALGHISDGELIDCTEQIVSDVAGTLYGAAVDTLYGVISTVILSACLHPEMQARAQEEMDRVVGRHRLPCLEDSDSLPYTIALIKEAMRMYPIGPLGVPRVATDDSVIDGFTIPKGSVVISNIWAVSRVPGGCGVPPDNFYPERFLSPDPPPDPTRYSFGAGRRMCLGKSVAENFIYAMAPALLAAYKILPPLSPSQQEQPLDVKWHVSAAFFPEFACRFVARNEALIDDLART